MKRLISQTVVLDAENIDTDQIIPAQFLTTTSREGLGAHLFYAWRFDEAGNPRDGALSHVDTASHNILVAGHNFGCGSSREHAPWALTDFGFRAVISTGIADIFRSNALKNGLLPIEVDKGTHQWLVANPGASITIDLEQQTLDLPNGSRCDFEVEAFARHCLLNGVDQLGFLLAQADAVRNWETERQK